MVSTKKQTNIFRQLFEYAQETSSKLILLEQVLELGEEEEIVLLEELENSENLKVRKRAYEVKCILKAKLESKQENTKLPMNLCFLYDEFEIHPPISHIDLGIDFEISLEILSEEAMN